MVELQINTTQNVNINFIAASVGERILAFIIDLIIKVAYAVVTYQIMFKLFQIDEMVMEMDQWSQMAVYGIFFLPIVFYSLVFETWLDGQTPGKRIMKIKVVKIDGYQASLADYMIRWFFRIIDLNMFSGVVALIAIVTSKKSQRLGDMTAGTSVITLKNKININHTILEELDDDYVPTYPNVIKLSDNDARIIKETFIKAKASRDYETLVKLRKKVVEVVGIKDYNDHDIKFIDVILKDYNYYTQSM
ncbi:RDD family protein [Subsaximicrobium wynnwilliamsii]|uniref:RDD family protein n=1 Tax=Subsaximicrobium wynnwilliamsii TaxID=291179 RepID=A0A5C6ZD91_9FLAO|nr:RDD family protein [Subsaximicrobium wynnwilliamsii]TXD81950.1 RDD family protein [Subsaximicrobium wynnwilliamsii]TXD87648.1 RDD family protein [Subsaximicrobium wynnwilliamsii]TXE01395.1 RDD family protein [Subsaximicrobium wynnwilliamsii]